jgi:uncharacterized integral membrane protein (TIGR00698 family)
MAHSKSGDYSWADYLIYMEAGADIASIPAVTRSVDNLKETKKAIGWGLAAVLCITIAASGTSRLPVWPFTVAGGQHPIDPVMMAILLGMIVGNIVPLPKRFHPGITFAIKKILPFGIILLGVRLNLLDLLKVGLAGLLLGVLEIVAALGLFLLLKNWLGLPGKLATLLGVGTAICGGSAIVATAPVIEAEEKEVAFSVGTVSFLGLLAMFTLPLVGHFLDLSSKAFGIWAGLAIHQTPQVVAAGFAYTVEAGEMATIVKLSRVCLLAPVVFVVGVFYSRRKVKAGASVTARKTNYRHMFPLFVLGLLGMVVLRTLGLVPDLTIHLPKESLVGASNHTLSLVTLLREISNFCIVLSMAGVGLETRLSLLKRIGPRPFLAGFIGAVTIAAFVLALVQLLGTV